MKPCGAVISVVFCLLLLSPWVGAVAVGGADQTLPARL